MLLLTSNERCRSIDKHITAKISAFVFSFICEGLLLLLRTTRRRRGCCTLFYEQFLQRRVDYCKFSSAVRNTSETAAIDGLVSSWSENISVSFCQRAPRYRLTLWCALGPLVGGAIQVPQLQLQLQLHQSTAENRRLYRLFLLFNCSSPLLSRFIVCNIC